MRSKPTRHYTGHLSKKLSFEQSQRTPSSHHNSRWYHSFHFKFLSRVTLWTTEVAGHSALGWAGALVASDALATLGTLSELEKLRGLETLAVLKTHSALENLQHLHTFSTSSKHEQSAEVHHLEKACWYCSLQALVGLSSETASQMHRWLRIRTWVGHRLSPSCCFSPISGKYGWAKVLRFPVVSFVPHLYLFVCFQYTCSTNSSAEWNVGGLEMDGEVGWRGGGGGTHSLRNQEYLFEAYKRRFE